ncbi:hypothetical protein F5I97DRAFT_1869133 [Phlebopus sp. FC_14]|nr:hypothetical protein F5I97DRAFT_1869133 [Phlebopus sp. FC_14]
MSDPVDDDASRTVAVLGGSYGGYRAAQILAAGLPRGWRVVLVDRNSHFNHVYNLPRYAVLPGHEHKAFIPYDNLFGVPSGSDPRTSTHPHKRIHGAITSLHSHSFTYILHSDSSSLVSTEFDNKQVEHVLHFDYAIYALGSHLPEPINLWASRHAVAGPSSSGSETRTKKEVEVAIEAHAKCSEDDLEEEVRRGHFEPTKYPKDAKPYTGMKSQGISWLRARQGRVEAARSVVIVGGGALGIQFASDIASIYPQKRVTLLHSRKQLLPRFDAALSDEVLQSLDELGVHVILGERLDLESLTRVGKSGEDGGPRGVRTTMGRELEGDLVLLCTGQTPNTDLLRGLDPRAVDEGSGMVKVTRSMQVLVPVDDNLEGGNHNMVDLEIYPGRRGQINNAEPTSTSTLSSPRTLCGTEPPSPVETLIELDVPMRTLYPHLFAIGDAADAFGAINAGHTAYYQGEVAARNVLRLIGRTVGHDAKSDNEDNEALEEPLLELEEYQAGPPMIKVSLGLTRSAYDVGGVVGTKEDGAGDLGAADVWCAYGYRDVEEEEMWR